MFASALQKRKAVVLSHSQSQSLSQSQSQSLSHSQSQSQPKTQVQPQVQLQSQQHAQPREAVVSASRNASGNGSNGGSASRSAAAGWSLSEMLSKKQKIETAPQESSGFVSAKSYQGGSGGSSMEQQQPKAVASIKTSLQAKAQQTKSRAAAGKAQQRQQSDDQEGVVFELSSKRRVTVRKWRSAVLIDIREFYDDNGISLSMDQWRSLQRLERTIDEAIALVEDNSVDEHSLQNVEGRISADSRERTIAFTLSSKRRISVRFFRAAVLIDLREFYDQDGVQKPGKKGISLSKEQWKSLCEAQQEVSEAASQL